MQETGTPASLAAGHRAGKSIGRYDVLRPIGRGAMGIVYEAVDAALGRRVAVKVMHAPADDAHARLLIQRFLREGRVAARVRHTHAVAVYDCGVDDGLPFLVMELVDGESLTQLLAREGPLPLDQVADILLPILSAVAELHAAGIGHRDIKPANILLSHGRAVFPKLADFGVSKLEDGSASLTQSGRLLGTLEYMAPELLSAGTHATEPSDQYALGVVLYECATGKRPFYGDTDYELMHAIATATFKLPSEHRPSLPEAFDKLVLRAMQREPADRFGCVDELAAALLPLGSADARRRWRTEFDPATGRRFGWETRRLGQLIATNRPSPTGWPPRRASAILLTATMLSVLAWGMLSGTRASSERRAISLVSERANAASAPTVATDSVLPTDPTPPASLPRASRSPNTTTGTVRSTRTRSSQIPGPGSPVRVTPLDAGVSDPIRGTNEAPILDVP